MSLTDPQNNSPSRVRPHIDLDPHEYRVVPRQPLLYSERWGSAICAILLVFCAGLIATYWYSGGPFLTAEFKWGVLMGVFLGEMFVLVPYSIDKPYNDRRLILAFALTTAAGLIYLGYCLATVVNLQQFLTAFGIGATFLAPLTLIALKDEYETFRTTGRLP